MLVAELGTECGIIRDPDVYVHMYMGFAIRWQTHHALEGRKTATDQLP